MLTWLYVHIFTLRYIMIHPENALNAINNMIVINKYELNLISDMLFKKKSVQGITFHKVYKNN